MKLRTTVVMFVLLGLGLTALAYGVDRASAVVERPATAAPSASPTPTASASVAPDPTATPTPTPTPTTTTAPRTRTPKPRPKPTPTMTPGPVLIGQGTSSDRVRDLQARLQQIGWFSPDVTGYFGDTTAASVRGFQAKRGIPVTGAVDQRTLDRLYGMTRTPTYDELHNIEPAPAAGGALDARCRVGRVLCIDKSANTLRWVVDGTVRSTFAVRFGATGTPTREGRFSVYAKSRNHVSRLYGSAMPFAMFFSGGQAVHYSTDFAARGYSGASHGCVNVRDYAGIAALYDQVAIGDAVVVYWS